MGVVASGTFLMGNPGVSLGNDNFQLYNVHHVEISLFHFELEQKNYHYFILNLNRRIPFSAVLNFVTNVVTTWSPSQKRGGTTRMTGMLS